MSKKKFKMKKTKFSDLVRMANYYRSPEEIPGDDDSFWEILGGLWAIIFIGFLIAGVLAMFGII